MTERSLESKQDHKGAIMEANNLSYKFDDILNVSTSRTMKKQYFDTRTYSSADSGQAVSTWNSGTSLIDCRNSYLKFSFTPTIDAAGSFGEGSVMNLIKEVKVLSSSGVELCRTQEANVYHKFVARSRRSANWQNTTGAMMGASNSASAGNVLTNATAVTYVIPLCELDPFFDLYDGKLMPANIASGLRIEITWETPIIAIFGAITPLTASYVISNIEFRTESVTLADSAMAVLNKDASSGGGLEVTYDRIYTTTKNTTTADDNIEVRKAVSLSKSCFAVCIRTAVRVITADSFKSETWDFTSADFRLGNSYIPFNPITDSVEGYFHYMRNYNKLKSTADTSTTLVDFTTGGQSQITATLESDDSLNLTGLPINSSRILECRFTRGTANAVKTYVFLTYTALCRASLSNASVKI